MAIWQMLGFDSFYKVDVITEYERRTIWTFEAVDGEWRSIHEGFICGWLYTISAPYVRYPSVAWTVLWINVFVTIF